MELPSTKAAITLVLRSILNIFIPILYMTTQALSSVFGVILRNIFEKGLTNSIIVVIMWWEVGKSGYIPLMRIVPPI